MAFFDFQPSFSGGEFSPKLGARIDIQKYKTGLTTCRNFINSPHGPVVNRPGSFFVHATKYSNKKSRLVPFVFSTGDAGVVEFSDKRIRFFSNGSILTVIPTAWSGVKTYLVGDYATFGGITYQCILANVNQLPPSATYWAVIPVISPSAWTSAINYHVGEYVSYSGGIYQCLVANTNHLPNAGGGYWTLLGAPPTSETPYEIGTSYLEADLPLLRFAQSGDTIYIAHQKYPPMVLQRQAGQAGLPWSGGFTFTAFHFVNGPFMPPNTSFYLSSSTGGVVNQYLNSSGAFFNANKIGAWLTIEKYIGAYSYVVDLTNAVAPTSSSLFACGGSWRLVTTGTWTGTIVVQKSENGGISWTDLQTFVSNNDANINTFGTEPLVNGWKPFLIRLKPQVLTSGTAHAVFSIDAFTARLYGQIPDFISSTRITNPFLSDFLFNSNTQNGIGVGVQMPIWSEGSWSVDRGWPGVVSFFQDRLVFASTPSEPQSGWFSQSSNYSEFAVSSPLVDSDSIGINLLSRTLNRIRSLLSFLNSLMNFTDSSEWNITSNSGGAISPTSAFAKLQGVRGTGDVEPIMIGNRIVFVEPRGSTLRDMVYEYLSDTFSSIDRGIISDHLFEGHSIVSMAYQQEPDSLLWLVRDDGVLLCLTYVLEQEVFAWSRHDTDGQVESICTIPGSNVDELWMVVNRSTGRFIEKITQRTLSTNPADQYFVDCGVSYSGVPTTSVPGLDHLNGKTVAINADGFVLPQQVVSGGHIALSTAASKVQVGLPFFSDLESLGMELPMPNGSFQGRKYSLSKVVVRFLNSRGGYIGMDTNSLTDQIDDHRDASLDPLTPTPLFSGYTPQTLPQNDDSYGHFFYRQTDPMPVTILGINYIVSPGENS